MKRPLSPHLTIYKPQITSLLSICHRISGACLSFAFFIFTAWIVLLTAGYEYEALLTLFFSNIITKIILFGASIAYFYHLCSGIRHLIWDLGIGFEIKTVNKTGWLALVATFVITALFWINIG